MSVKKIEQHNEFLDIIAFLRQCAKFYIEAHHYIHDNICMLDYPPESMFDDFILQEENKCLLERTEDYDLEIEAIEKLKDKIEKAKEEYIQGKINSTPAGFVAGYDIETGYICADYSRTTIKKEELNEQLRDLIDQKVKEGKIGEYGQKVSSTSNLEIGRCAEVHVVDKILSFNEKFNKNNNSIDNIRLSFAVRFKNKRKIENTLNKLRIKQESTGYDVYNHWIKMLNDTETKYLPYCFICNAMFEGTYILKERFF